MVSQGIKSITHRLLEILFDIVLFVVALQPWELLTLAHGVIAKLIRKIFGIPTNDRDNALDIDIQILARAPQDNWVTKNFLGMFLKELWDFMPKPFHVVPPDGVDFKSIKTNLPYRTVDGRGNSALYPAVGMGGTKYAEMAPRITGPTPLPDPEKIFEVLIKRPNNKFKPHPNNINVVMFYFATIITHDLFWTDRNNRQYNTASSYADLQPLYGRTEEDLKAIRTFKKGKLYPDYFTDRRMTLQLPGVTALIVLFSRNHNYICDVILAINEGGRFSNISPEKLDEELFQTARLINNGCYTNLIIHDYLRTILGISSDSPFVLNPAQDPPAPNPTYGNQSAMSFGYVYRWHSSIGQEDAETAVKLFKESDRPSNPIKAQTIGQGLSIYSLQRQTGPDPEHGGPFSDEDLADVLLKAMGQVAGHLGARHVPAVFKTAEIEAIMQGRARNISTLNDYRQHFGLKRYKRFEEVNNNPKVIKGLRDLYGHPDNIELYPGLVSEQTQDAACGVGVNKGISLGYTTAMGILADATNLIRNDRFMTNDFTPQRLTHWGYQMCTDPGSIGIAHNNKSLFPHLISMLHGAIPLTHSKLKEPFKV